MDWDSKIDVAKALLGLHNRQTWDEQLSASTNEDNGVGFNKIDAPILTDISEWISSGKPFTDKQFDLVSRTIKKYSSQISNIDLELIDVPDSCFNSTKKDNGLTGDGLIKLENGRLLFFPNVYPSTVVKQYGFRWNYDCKCYEAQASIDKVENVRDLFKDVVLSEEVFEWMYNVPEVELSEEASTSDMFIYQKDGSKFLITAKKAMLAFAPGLGKSITSIFAAHEVGGTVLVVCPKTLMINWKREVHKWLGDDVPVAIWYGEKSNWEKLRRVEGRGFVVTNYDTLRTKFVSRIKGDDGKFRFTPKFDFSIFNVAIIDESVLIKNRKAQRTLAIEAVVKKINYLWMLSGAPTTRFYDDLWSQFHILFPQRFKSYWRFVDTYTVTRHNGWGIQIVANQPDAAQRIQRDCRDIYMARTQDQVLDLPPWIIDNVYVSMDPVQYKPYKQMEEEFMALLPEGDYILAPNVLSQLLRLVQIASNPVLLDGADIGAKWDALEEIFEYEELPAIVWTTFKKTAKLVAERLENKKLRVGVLTGDSSSESRQLTVDQFQGGELDIIVAHPGVGKFGLTLTAARTAIYLERGYAADDYYQSLHRVRRIGTKYSPHVIHLIAEGPKGEVTVDSVIDKVLSFRTKSSVTLTSGVLREAWKR